MERVNGIGDFWERQEEAARDFRQRFINGALEAERADNNVAGSQAGTKIIQHKEYLVE
jgi:hypothetical protein